MTFIKCGTKMFDPKAVTAVWFAYGPERDDVSVGLHGELMTFTGAEADAVRGYFASLPIHDLMPPAEADTPEPAAVNHHEKDC
jgi:hypothetical protein